MSKPIYEESAKSIIYKHIDFPLLSKNYIKVLNSNDDVRELTEEWLLRNKLVIKPDVLLKRRGKLGLVYANKNLDEAKQWLKERLGKSIEVGSTSGILHRFLIEPFVPHKSSEEYYICIYTQRECNVILFYHEGGVDVGDVDQKANRLEVSMADLLHSDGKSNFSVDALLESSLFSNVKCNNRVTLLANFVYALHTVFDQMHFSYLEINPLVICDWPLSNDANNLFVHILDVAAKLDHCAEYLFTGDHGWCNDQQTGFAFPLPFGKKQTTEEAYIAKLDAHTGASLKLSILNPEGRIWTLSAGGGASVIYADTVCELAERVKASGGSSMGALELANYGEYSGAPTEGQTYDYAKTLLSLMTSGKCHPNGKVLLIGGGIANFTNVAKTFKGIVTALTEFEDKLREHKVRIFVRRAGPNYQEGLRIMSELGHTIDIPIHVFGPETHMTSIVSMAYSLREIPSPKHLAHKHTTDSAFHISYGSTNAIDDVQPQCENPPLGEAVTNHSAIDSPYVEIFTAQTRCLVWGLQLNAVQSMLDFDYASSRSIPSVAGLINPFNEDHQLKFYWGSKEIYLPVYKHMLMAIRKHSDANVLVNFASLRTAHAVTMEAMDVDCFIDDGTVGDNNNNNNGTKEAQFKCIAIIAEGIPENFTRCLIQRAKERQILLVGPATVGCLKPGNFKIGNTGGMTDNIIASKLYRPGSVAYVSRSGGLSNELNNIISLNSDGVEEGVAIGGDRFPGSTFLDHLLRYEKNPKVSMMVMLGEVGGVEEYAVAEAVQTGKIRKPIVAWCIGTCAELLSSALSEQGGTESIQFGHAGACANSKRETATAKNEALRQAGVHVPSSFNELDLLIRRVFDDLALSGHLIPKPDRAPRRLPIDYNWAKELGLIRRPAAFTSTICDDRGQELLYAGIPIGRVIEEGLGIGGVLGLLWFKRRLPEYAAKFLELCLIITADHGPAVSGAHNTIVTARAGKDLISSLVSGLLTIGDRFGGALDAAARQFSEAFDKGLKPDKFVERERQASRLIMGIGHRVKSVTNPDRRVQILSTYVHQHFPATPIVDYAMEVEKVTTTKRPNLILNVDGMIGVAMVDLLRNCGHFTREEADEYVKIGTLNGLFVLGRSIGFIGHYMDQKRLHQPLYRHPWEDISYVLPDNS